MALWKKLVLRNEFEEGSDTGGGLDIEAASDEIGAGLGFGKEESQSEEKPNDPAPVPVARAEPPAAGPTPPPEPATPAAAAAPAPAGAPAPDGAAPPVTPAAPVRFTADAPPSTWTAAASQQWASLPLSIREEVARRENNMFQGLELYKGDASIGREMKSVLAPVLPNLMSQKIHPKDFVQALVTTHGQIADTNTPVEKRAELALGLLKSYGIDLPAMFAGQGQAAPASGTTPPYVDPEVTTLRETVAALESRINESATRAAEQERQQRQQAIEAFAADPAHPHFFDVTDEIAMLIRGSGGKLSLDDAYKQAIRLNPVTAAAEMERLQAEAVARANKEADERAKAARKASAGRVRTNGHQGGETADSGSMEDTMAATLAGIRQREK